MENNNTQSKVEGEKPDFELSEQAANRAREIYPEANEDDYPDNPNVNRLNRACVGAFVSGFDYAKTIVVAPLRSRTKELEQELDKAKEYQGMWLDRGVEIANLKARIKELESSQPSPVETPVRSAVEELSEKEFCRMYTQYHGEEINNIRQLVCASFSGEELMEFVQHCLKSRPSVVGEKDRKHIAQILRDNITFSGQVGDYVIHGAIDKIIQWANSRVGEKEEQRFTIEDMREAFIAGWADCAWSGMIEFDEWIKTRKQ